MHIIQNFVKSAGASREERLCPMLPWYAATLTPRFPPPNLMHVARCRRSTWLTTVLQQIEDCLRIVYQLIPFAFSNLLLPTSSMASVTFCCCEDTDLLLSWFLKSGLVRIMASRRWRNQDIHQSYACTHWRAKLQAARPSRSDDIASVVDSNS